MKPGETDGFRECWGTLADADPHLLDLYHVNHSRAALSEIAGDSKALPNRPFDGIFTCETRWKNESGALATEQIGWLTWAKEIAGAISPFSIGYPDPAKDGAFDSNLIPPGGPYPATRNFK